MDEEKKIIERSENCERSLNGIVIIILTVLDSFLGFVNTLFEVNWQRKE